MEDVFLFRHVTCTYTLKRGTGGAESCSGLFYSQRDRVFEWKQSSIPTRSDIQMIRYVVCVMCILCGL